MRRARCVLYNDRNPIMNQIRPAEEVYGIRTGTYSTTVYYEVIVIAFVNTVQYW